MKMMLALRLSTALFAAQTVAFVTAWSSPITKLALGRPSSTLFAEQPSSDGADSRRTFLTVTTSAVASLLVFPSDAQAVTRAIGGAEVECRKNGNCLELGEWDGAVGWTWGGKDRCDANDPKCGPNGKILDEIPSGQPVPKITNKVTDVVSVSLSIGRTDSGTLNIGLYGDDAPASVAQFLKFIGTGLTTTSELAFQNGMGVQSIPVSMTRGGILGEVVPNQRLDFGVPSQGAAYARSRGLSKSGDDYLPQPRPKAIEEAPTRSHDVAGLLSVPAKGIGFGGGGFAGDDECFESAFQITAANVPSMDSSKEARRVIGQIMDAESMAFLARLSSLPTKKGFKGIVPGQNSGPPLLAVKVTEVDYQPTASRAH